MLHEYIRPGTESCRHRGLVEARIPGKRPHDAAGWRPEALLHPRHQYPRCAVPQFRHPQILGGTDRGRLDLPAQQLHRQCHFAPVEPAVFLRREDRSRDRGDSLDLEVFLKERPRVNNWDFEGISKGKKKDLLEKLKLKRGSELSDYIIDKNKKLIKAYWSEKPSAIRRWTCASPTTRCARRW